MVAVTLYNVTCSSCEIVYLIFNVAKLLQSIIGSECRKDLYDIHKSSAVSMDEFVINIGTLIALDRNFDIELI